MQNAQQFHLRRQWEFGHFVEKQHAPARQFQLTRLRLLRATATHLSPIYGTVSGPCAPLAALLERTCREAPVEELLDEEGVTHRLWEIPREEPIDAWLRDEELLIADGHHRYTTALAYRDERHAADGPGPWDAIFALVVDAGTESVPVLPYHRVQVAGEALAPSRPATDLDDVLARVSDEGLAVGGDRKSVV